MSDTIVLYCDARKCYYHHSRIPNCCNKLTVEIDKRGKCKEPKKGRRRKKK